MFQPTTPRFPPLFVLAGGVLAVSASAILIRWAQAEAPSLTIAAWRLLLAALILLPQALWRRRAELRRLDRAGYGLCLLSGAMLGIHFATWISSLAYTDIASSTVLVTTMPLWVALASPFVLGERLGRPVAIAVAVALLGSSFIALDGVLSWHGDGLQLSLTPGGDRRPLLGGALALAGAVSGAAYILIGRRLRVRLSLLSYITLVYGAAALFLLALAWLGGAPMLGYSPRIYGLFLLMALFPQLLGHTSYNWALAYLPAAFVTIATVSEPVGASLLAVLIFQEVPGGLTLLGSSAILGAVILAGQGVRQRNRSPSTAATGPAPAGEETEITAAGAAMQEDR